jgi:hypothetical protein
MGRIDKKSGSEILTSKLKDPWDAGRVETVVQSSVRAVESAVIADQATR